MKIKAAVLREPNKPMTIEEIISARVEKYTAKKYYEKGLFKERLLSTASIIYKPNSEKAKIIKCCNKLWKYIKSKSDITHLYDPEEHSKIEQERIRDNYSNVKGEEISTNNPILNNDNILQKQIINHHRPLLVNRFLSQLAPDQF